MGVDRNAWRPDFGEKVSLRCALELVSAGARWRQDAGQGRDLFDLLCQLQRAGDRARFDRDPQSQRDPYVLVDKEACCGMPKLEIGDLESVERFKNINVPQLAQFAREGYAIVTAVPSCTLMYKQELPLMFPEDADVALVKEAMWDPFEYLVARRRDGLLKADFKQPLGIVSYHVPCHARVQNVGQDRRAIEVVA